MINMNMVRKFQGCLLGVAIGDAMGMPVETLKRSRIYEETGGLGVQGFLAPLADRKWMKGLEPGMTTDDWQLTTVVARSIIRKRRFDLRDIAEEHVLALKASTFGWGGTTRRAIEELRDEKRRFDQLAPDYGPKKGAGNGIIMKVAPLALHHLAGKQQDLSNLRRNVMSLGGLTHNSTVASLTAYCVARIMADAFNHPCKTSDGVRGLLLNVVADIKSEFKAEDAEEVSARLLKLLDTNVTESSEALEEAVGNGFHCLDTMAFTVGTFLRHPTDFRAGVLEAVNAGGDADTNASVVGALIGINTGIEYIPKEWREFNPSFQEAIDLGYQFCA